MNTRVLELIKNPKIITESDLDILASESEKTPYAQSIRALYLYGINLYQPEKYKENLSRTAAYTTDKKILYQFITSEKINKKKPLPNAQPALEDANIQPTKEINKTPEEQITPEELPQEEIEEKPEEKPVNITDSNENIEAEKVSKPSYNISPSITFTSANNIVYQINNTKTQSGKTGFPIPQTVVSKKVIERPAEEELSEPANPELIAEIEQAETPSLNKFDINKIIESEDQEGSEFIVVEGEKNRLLYEGEENFMAEQTPELDLEATAESGELTLKQENETVVTPIVPAENRPEEVLFENNNGLQSNEPVESTVKDENDDISFGGAQDFMPDVKFSVPKNHLDYLNPPKYETQLTKEDQHKTGHHYEGPTLQEDLEIQDADAVSFAETQAFDFANAEIEPNKIEHNSDDKIVIADIPEPEDNGWKPMQFSGNTPDALIGKPEKEPTVEEEPAVSEKFKIDLIEEPMVQDNEQEDGPEENFVVEESTVETPQEPKEEELPVINVSFFGDDVAKIEDHKEIPVTSSVEKPKQNDDSNVGRFINTWQNWLKIERNDQPEQKVTKKEKIIDNFIENNPKISQLKDENAYVIKERKDDISHLMTETLARLYTEQKLYTKAIKAYEILSKKHPEKKAYFEDKIEEVKEIRKP